MTKADSATAECGETVSEAVVVVFGLPVGQEQPANLADLVVEQLNSVAAHMIPIPQVSTTTNIRYPF